MNRLGEYKKAEKVAKDIIVDSEQMKLKYFNVLTENEQFKNQVKEFSEYKFDNDKLVKEMTDENVSSRNDVYTLRMDISKKIDELAKSSQQIQYLKEKLSASMLQASDFIIKEKEVSKL